MSNHYGYDMMAHNIITTQRCLPIRLFHRKWKTAAAEQNIIKCCTRYTQTADLSVNDEVSDTSSFSKNYGNISESNNNRYHSAVQACRTDRCIQVAWVKEL